MDFIKLEAQEQPLDDDGFADKPTCLLEDDDLQCGHIVYNENSRVLKYICTFCHKTYDNIEYFCQHLSEHIYTSPDEEDIGYVEQPCEDIEDCKENVITNVSCFAGDNNDLGYEKTDYSPTTHQSLYSHSDCFSNPELNTNAVACTILKDLDCHSDASDMIIEEIEDVEDMPANTPEHLLESLADNESNVGFEDKSCSNEFIAYEDEERKSYNAKHGNSFEECFLKESNIEKIRTQGVCVLRENKGQNKPAQKKRTNMQDLLRLRRKRKKVTTVKVIAVKNRIAELYDRIRKQQAQSQQIMASNGYMHPEHSSESVNLAHVEQETQDASETFARTHEDSYNDASISTNPLKEVDTKELTRKIIGETLITLIPEGTKIPNTLPSAMDKIPENVNFSMPPKMENTSSIPPFKHMTNDKRAICPACGKIFRSHFSLTIHKRIHYLESDSSVKLAHKCSDCDQLFNKLSQLKQHVESIHYPDGFVCKICNRKLSSLSLLERHMVKVHLDRPFNCQQCGKNFSDPVTYEEHIVSHTSGEIYKCHICGRKYSTEFFLMEHMRNHKEQVPQTCVVCGKVTLRITQHMKIHTPRPKRLLSCSVCGKVFNFSSGLSHHFKIMHKLPRPPPKPKKEPNPNAQKRKRKPRNVEKLNKKKNNLFIPSSESSFHDAGQIIEEPSEIPDEVYNEEDAQAILQLAPSTELQHAQQHTNESSVDVNDENHMQHLLHHHHHHDHHHLDEEDVNHKEEEAKRVIVELIQNSTYTSFFPDNLSSVLEVTPPIAREETISAVNSIVHDC